MNEMKVARGLGWFSIGLGLTEVVAGRQLGRVLGMEDRTWLLRLFGLREIASGVAIFARDNPKAGVWSRVAGDALDLAALGSVCTEDNPKRANVMSAIGSIAGILALDVWCARRLHSARPHGSMRTHWKYVAEGPTHRSSSGALPAAGR